MVRSILTATVVFGFCLGAGLGCSLRKTSAPPLLPPPVKSVFAVEGMKKGQWQTVAQVPVVSEARRRAEQVRKTGDFEAVRIRTVAYNPATSATTPKVQ